MTRGCYRAEMIPKLLRSSGWDAAEVLLPIYVHQPLESQYGPDEARMPERTCRQGSVPGNPKPDPTSLAR